MSHEIDRSEGSSSSSSDASTVGKVFQIDEIREAILRYAIYNSERKLSRKMVKSVRLVQGSWLQTTSNLLRKAKEPVIELTVDGNGSLKDANDGTSKGKLLDQLLETFGASTGTQDSFLPVKLHFKLDFFRERNYQSLSDILTRFGSNVVELQLEYPKSGGTMPAIFPPFGLPLLHKLTFQFSNDRLGKDSNDDANGFDDNRNGLMLLQSILTASKGIRDLIIPYSRSVDVVPVEFKYIRLPATISFLNMRIKLRSSDLQVFLRNQLPNLSRLTLRLHDFPFEDGLLFQILERFQNTIEILDIVGLSSTGNPRPPTLLRLPLLQQLKEIKIVSFECELGPGDVSALQLCLPALKIVQLGYQTDVRLAKWIQNSRFENVEQLTLSVVNEQMESKHENFYISPRYEILTQLHQSFPNVSHLTLAVNVSDLASLKHLFQHFVQLKTLRILIYGNQAAIATSSDLIDSIFLGLPLRFVVALKEEMHLLDTGTIAFNRGSEPSIRNLSELYSLTLWTDKINDATLEERMSLMSNLLFRHAFMKMTKLRYLFLYKKFQVRIAAKLPTNVQKVDNVPSLEMQQTWRGQGRYMKYLTD